MLHHIVKKYWLSLESKRFGQFCAHVGLVTFVSFFFINSWVTQIPNYLNGTQMLRAVVSFFEVLSLKTWHRAENRVVKLRFYLLFILVISFFLIYVVNY